MADITLEAYVQDRNGKRVRVSEQYRRKNDMGEWETSGYGDYTLWLRSEEAAPEVQVGAVVVAVGRLMVTKSEKDGKSYTNLNVNVNHIGIARTTAKYGGVQSVVRETRPSQDAWAEPSFTDEPPF